MFKLRMQVDKMNYKPPMKAVITTFRLSTKTMKQIKRRTFLKQFSAVSMAPFMLPTNAPYQLKQKVALQLVSVIPSCRQDLAGTLRSLAKMGYKGVEFSSRFGNLFGKKPVEMRKILDDNGLVCAGWHPIPKELENVSLPQSIATAHAIGAKYLIQAELPVSQQEISSREAWLRAAEKFNILSSLLKPEGLSIGYHNHTEEWTRFENTNGWEVFFDTTSGDVVHQIDTAHCLKGGGDPVSMIRKYKGRTRTIHLKERGINDFGSGEPAFGKGKVAWAEVFKACEQEGGTEWYIMERYMGQTPDRNNDIEGAKQYIEFMKSRKKA
jgi:sugar phosphate isomerase/epimerase